jgi:hypothetical protein
MADIRGFAAHSQVGYGSLFDVFNDPARRASTHFWISQTGVLEQYVDTDTQAWAHGPGNPYFWSSEFEGMSYNDGPREMEGDPFTSAQIDKAGELIAWLHGLAEFPVVINTEGLAGHGLTPHRLLMQTACPGMLRLSQYQELVLATLRHLDPNPAPTPTPPPPEEDDMNLAQYVLAVEAAYKMAGNTDLPHQLEWCRKIANAATVAEKDHELASMLNALG